MRLGEDGSLVDKATSPLPVQPTTISTTFTDLQAQLQAMNGTMESVPSTDNAAGKQLLQAPIIPNLINTAGKPAEISVSLSLNLPQAGNPLSNGAKPPAITNTNNNIPTVGMPSTNPLETSNPILQQGMHQLNGFAGLVAEDTDSDDTNNLDSGIDSKTSSALPGPTDTSIDITTSGILPTSTSHQPAGVASGNSVPQFVSAAQQPAEQVADGTIYSVKNGHKELIIRLNPDNLGEVRINLTSHGNQELSARMIASTQESHDLLKGQMDTLKQRLESQGIQIDRLSVVMAGHTESQANTGHGHQQSFQHETFTQQNSAQSQQWTNQDQQPNQGTFAQMQSQFQQKQGMTQPQLQRAFTGNGQAMNVLPEGAQKPDNSGQGNDNGRISILV
jgi:flagellar hook-length control protein FliK